MTPRPTRRGKGAGCSIIEDDAIHYWFGLSYANYLALNRSLLQSMPAAWQRRFVALLNELHEAFGHLDHPAGYRVTATDASGRFIKDPIPHYDRGRTRVEPRRRKP